jgi:hypothetical protein
MSQEIAALFAGVRSAKDGSKLRTWQPPRPSLLPAAQVVTMSTRRKSCYRMKVGKTKEPEADLS